MRSRLGLELVLIGLVVALAAVAWDVSYVAANEEGGHSGTHSHDVGAWVHNVAATVVVGIGVLVSVVGSRFALLSGTATGPKYAQFGASSLLLADGVLHFYAVSEHLGSWPFIAFFVASGGVLVVLAFWMFRAQPLAYWLSVFALVGLIALFFYSRTVAPPFADAPEAYDALGLLSKGLEFAALGVLGLLLYWRVDTSAKEAAES